MSVPEIYVSNGRILVPVAQHFLGLLGLTLAQIGQLLLLRCRAWQPDETLVVDEALYLFYPVFEILAMHGFFVLVRADKRLIRLHYLEEVRVSPVHLHCPIGGVFRPVDGVGLEPFRMRGIRIRGVLRKSTCNQKASEEKRPVFLLHLRGV